MGCDYYIQKEFVIEYECKDGKINTIVTNKTTEKGYIFSFDDSGYIFLHNFFTIIFINL